MVVAGVSGSALAAAEKADDGPVTVRHKFVPGRLLRYNLKLAGQSAWTPTVRGATWGQMATDFTFTLRTKTLRPTGLCTFELLGERLQSAGQTSAGRIAVAATRAQSRLGVAGKEAVAIGSKKSPLQHPMTMTFGPKGRFSFGTGLLPIAIYMVPHIDHRFWTLLTLAPDKPISPGDQWEVEFTLPLPGSKGKPLKVKGKWKVLGWEKQGKRDLLSVALTAKLQLRNAEHILLNGDKIHIATGSYEASGKVRWDVESGLLYSATARQRLHAKSDLPIWRVLLGEAESTLTLLGSQDPKPPRK